MKVAVKITAVTLLLAASTAIMAEDMSKADQAIYNRKSVMKTLGLHFGPLAAMAQGKAPYNQDVASKNAEILSALSRTPVNLFPAGSEKGDKLVTQVEPAAWTDTKFKDAFQKFQQEAGKLGEVAKGGDEAAIKAQAGALGKTCKGCHDDFRKD